jgi:quinol-cytochrome oxidoreductase complex cytochrome b subunit
VFVLSQAVNAVVDRDVLSFVDSKLLVQVVCSHIGSQTCFFGMPIFKRSSARRTARQPMCCWVWLISVCFSSACSAWNVRAHESDVLIYLCACNVTLF